jgi:NAD(P)-dependent dehydrogenase (short-subunit alcohol dehydrogenase family)
MSDRLKGKVAIIVGAGQTSGETIGNGRAAAIVYGREGAKCLCVNRSLKSAAETSEMIEREGGEAVALQADAAREEDCKRITAACLEHFGRIDILHNNVGIGYARGSLSHLAEADWDYILGVNLKSVFLTCKHVIPVMRAQGSGSILNISSTAAVSSVKFLAYKTSKAGVNAMTQQLAIANARYGIRVNAIMPGHIDTPVAIEAATKALGIPRDRIRAERGTQVPLGKMGTAWDIAYAALFLVSDEARFITGVILPVDGGQCARIG